MSWQVDFGGMKDGFFKREMIKKASQINALVNYFNNQDVYVGCYYKKEGLLYGYFYLDFDCDLESDFDLMKEETLAVYDQIQSDFDLEHQHMQLYFSGAKGFHLLIAPHNLGFMPCGNLNALYKNLALYYKKISPRIDTKIYDDRRVFRKPNSINSKTGLYKIPITYDELILSDYKKICELASNQRGVIHHAYIQTSHNKKNIEVQKRLVNVINKEIEAKKKMQSKVFDRSLIDKNVIFPCIERMLNDIHGEGERNKRLIIIASHLLQKDISQEEVTDFLVDWNQSHFEPPLDAQEVSVTVASAKHQLDQGRKYGCHAILEIDYCDFKCDYIRGNSDGNEYDHEQHTNRET